MAKYFFDTYAILEIIKNNGNYAPYLGEPIMTSVLNIGELYNSLLRESTEKLALFWFDTLKDMAMPVGLGTIKSAMEFRHANRKKNFSMVDCIGYQLARENNLIFLTGDKEFEGIENVEFVK